MEIHFPKINFKFEIQKQRGWNSPFELVTNLEIVAGERDVLWKPWLPKISVSANIAPNVERRVTMMWKRKISKFVLAIYANKAFLNEGKIEHSCIGWCSDKANGPCSIGIDISDGRPVNHCLPVRAIIAPSHNLEISYRLVSIVSNGKSHEVDDPFISKTRTISMC